MDAFDQLKVRKVLSDFEKLKQNISEWVVALDSKQYELESRIKVLEQQLQYMKTWKKWY